MSKLSQATYLAAGIVMVVLPLGAQQGCGGDETEETTPASGCPGAQTLCGTLCVDTTSDETNCGVCGNTCRVDQECTASSCQCPTGRQDCGTSCSLVMTDPTNCGECGTVCPSMQTCINGDCQCPGGEQLCGDACADTETDKQHCGGCDQPCETSQDCVDGECVCTDNKTLCGTECVDTDTNARFCGNCTTACDEGEFCDEGNCATIANCADVALDSYENNETCETGRELTESPEAMGVTTVGDATLHHQDATVDTDWYSVLSTEGSHDCSFLSGQCYFTFTVEFTPPAGADHSVYEVCIYDGDCGQLENEVCTTAANWQTDHYELTSQWEGTCFFSDDLVHYIKVTRTGGTESCAQYTLKYETGYTDEGCP